MTVEIYTFEKLQCICIQHYKGVLDFDPFRPPGIRSWVCSFGISENPPRYSSSKYECSVISDNWDIGIWKTLTQCDWNGTHFFFFFFFFYLGFMALSRIFHLYQADRSSKVGENRRTQGKTTWPSVSRTWLSHMWLEWGSNHSCEKPNGSRVNSPKRARFGNANTDDWGDYKSSPCTSYQGTKNVDEHKTDRLTYRWLTWNHSNPHYLVTGHKKLSFL